MKKPTDFTAFDQEEGLTARDYFAAAALTGLLASMSNPEIRKEYLEDAAVEELSQNTLIIRDAYLIAEEMMISRLH
jgi:hypothetical protein